MRSHPRGAVVQGAPCYVGDAESMMHTRLQKPEVPTVWAAREKPAALWARIEGFGTWSWHSHETAPSASLSSQSVCLSPCHSLTLTHTLSHAVSNIDRSCSSFSFA